MIILTLNAGSSSIKFAVFVGEARTPELSGQVECIGLPRATAHFKRAGEEVRSELENGDSHSAIKAILSFVESELETPIDAIGHRIVHGGGVFSQTLQLTPEIVEEIRPLNRLAPLHNPANLAGIDACFEAFLSCPQFAIFDTAFHATIPECNFRYAVPVDWYSKHGIRRYGFHGISHEFITKEAIRHFDLNPDNNRILIAHLGNGCSATAVVNGQSIDTSMGFTPLEGLVMGTRSGSIDPGILPHIMRETKQDIDEIIRILNQESGLLGLSGVSDMRELIRAIEGGQEKAQLAIEVFTHRLVKELASLTASLGGLPHLLVFTGGIGENNSQLRADVLSQLAWMGFEIDPLSNAAPNNGPRCISIDDSRLAAVIPTNEELAIARACRKALGTATA